MGPRRVAVVVFPGIQSLDAVGPIEVFSTANRQVGQQEYALELVAARGTSVRATNGPNPGCSTLTMGGTCVEHDPPVTVTFTRGRPYVANATTDAVRVPVAG